jgi:hypothetical protein
LRSRIERALPRPATGRLGIVSTYFLLAGISGVFVVAGITAAVVVHRLHWQTTPSNPILALVGAAIMTVPALVSPSWRACGAIWTKALLRTQASR